MVQTTFYGEIKNGHIVLPADVKLPDTARVYVTVSEVDTQPRRLRRMPTPRLKRPEPEQKGGAESVETQPKTMVYVPDLELIEGPRPRRILSPRLVDKSRAKFYEKIVEPDDGDEYDEI